ncbi:MULTISPECIES: PKD domain-containing protein [Halorussus]|uniref:COG1470 family protein n=1 Tax=Halorussus TaxID=1070314 RepID=UPI00209E4CE2|nr:PKD domain-containing protein [Halorussus vallis]USZ78153.1 PKD domain-containing protein [Halorussus vallis]
MNVNRATIASVALTLLVVVSAIPTGLVGLTGTARADNPGGDWYTIRQSGECMEVRAFPADHPKMVPEVVVRGTNTVGDVTGPYKDEDWNGPETIESIMDYRYRDGDQGQTSYYAPYLNNQYRYEPWEYGTYGLYNWSANGESHMFFYENADGDVSMVLRHDRIYEETGIASHRKYNGVYGNVSGDGFFEESPGGGRADFTFDGLPSGEWAYIDDMYRRADMDDVYNDTSGTRYGHREANYTSEPLRAYDPTEDGDTFDVHWEWGHGGTDGGAYRGMQNLNGEALTIDPGFSNVNSWKVRTNDGSENGEMKTLQMDQSLTIEEGRNCLDSDLSAEPSDTEAGGEVTFTASGGGDEYAWDFDGDGEVDANSTSNQITHTYNASGTVTAGVTITADGETITASTEVTVGPSEPPSASIGVSEGDGENVPEHHAVGEQLVFQANASDEGSGVTSDYVWRVDGGENRTGGDTFTHAFSEAGTHTVSVTVTDGVGNQRTVSTEVEVDEPDGTNPEARATATPTRLEAGAPVTFNASESTDNWGVASYRWEFEDGATANGVNATHDFDTSGTHNATVTVEDYYGNTDTANVSVDVFAADTPSIDHENTTFPRNATEAGTRLTFEAVASDNGTLTYEWQFPGDETKMGKQVTHEFAEPGEKSVLLVVRDAAGREDRKEMSVEVNAAPVANLTASPEIVNASETVTFDASGSSAPDGGEISKYEWDLDGDGTYDEETSAENTSLSHAYQNGGTFTAKVRVHTESGLSDTDTAQVVVKEKEAITDPGGGNGGSGGFVGGGGGGGGTAEPPSVVSDVQKQGANAAVVDVRNARAGKTVGGSLPASAVAAETGVSFDRLAVTFGDDDSHAAFPTKVTADAPTGAAALSDAEALAYLEVDSKYLDASLDRARVEFSVNESRLAGLASTEDASLYRYADGSWERLNTTVVERSGDTARLKASADGVGTFAVGATTALSVADAELSRTTVAKGGTVEATVAVENAADAERSATLDLTLGGERVASEQVTVAAGETKNVTLSADAPATGSYEVAVSGTDLGSLTVQKRPPADAAGVTDLSLNASTISAGDSVAITATVENTATVEVTKTVTLTLFGEQLATKNVTVPAGETEQVRFVQQVASSGEYTVDVNGERRSLSVQSDQESDGPVAPGVPGFGVGVTLVALVAAALLARYRSD